MSKGDTWSVQCPVCFQPEDFYTKKDADKRERELLKRLKRPKSQSEEIMWVVWSPTSGVVYGTNSATKADAIERFTHGTDVMWTRCLEWGYKVLKATITPKLPSSLKNEEVLDKDKEGK